MSWKDVSTDLIATIYDLYNGSNIDKNMRDVLRNKVENLQKVFIEDLESTKTHYSDRDMEKLKKENDELQYSLAETSTHYEGQVKKLVEEKAILNQELHKYRKRYKRSKQLVMGLTKFIEEMEDENE